MCEARTQTFYLEESQFLQPPVVKEIKFNFCSADPVEVVAAKVYESFGVEGNPKPHIRNWEPPLKIDDHVSMTFGIMPTPKCSGVKGYEIELTDKTLSEADKNARAQQMKQVAPTPKF